MICEALRSVPSLQLNSRDINTKEHPKNANFWGKHSRPQSFLLLLAGGPWHKSQSDTFFMGECHKCIEDLDPQYINYTEVINADLLSIISTVPSINLLSLALIICP